MVNDITGAHAHLVLRADVVVRWQIDGTLDLQNMNKTFPWVRFNSNGNYYELNTKMYY